MSAARDEPRRSEPRRDVPGTRRRAGLTLGGMLLVVLAGLAVLAAVVLARSATDPGEAPPADGADAPSSGSGQATDGAAGLARRQMLQLPALAAQPQPMTTNTAGAAITLPQPGDESGRWIPGGFPGTAEGALAQLTALNETALSAGDPKVYARGYAHVAAPGAPDPRSSGLYGLLRSFREHAQLPPSGPVPNATLTYEATHGLIKGTADSGRYAVVCVLGQVSVDVGGQVVTAGAGDCQAMSWTGWQWRIAPGAQAATAPSAWPGSADAVRAGYRELEQR